MPETDDLGVHEIRCADYSQRDWRGAGGPRIHRGSRVQPHLDVAPSALHQPARRQRAAWAARRNPTGRRGWGRCQVGRDRSVDAFAACRHQLTATPSHLPMRKVAPPAADPIRSIRNPPQSAPRPVNKLIVAPTQKSEAAAMVIDERSADGPAVTVKGINGRKAPRPKESS